MVRELREMLTGQAKKDYQREYMRDYMRRKRNPNYNSVKPYRVVKTYLVKTPDRDADGYPIYED